VACVFIDHATPMGAALAEAGAAAGAVVVVEPQVMGDRQSMARLMQTVHVLKYARQWAWRTAGARQLAQPMIEVETLGSEGLRYRLEAGQWYDLPVPVADRVVDTVGAGDWLTTGLIHNVCMDGVDGLPQEPIGSLRTGLEAGQALSLRTLTHRGARGGMTADPPPGHDPALWNQVPTTLGDVSSLCLHC